MPLTRGDDYPLHQTPEPIAFAGSDRNFYDRYFFNGFSPESGRGEMFALAFGVYPQLNIADAAFSILRDGRQTSVFASRWLDMERLDLRVGPIRIEVLEPLRALKVTVEARELGLEAELAFTARAAPLEEPRFTRRIGPRSFLDYTRMTQTGSWSGRAVRDGEVLDCDGFVGVRDRSWGVRPVGSRDLQPPSPPEPPQFFWIWGPSVLPGESLFFHLNADGQGRPWNTRAVRLTDGAAQGDGREFDAPRLEIDWRPGTRRAAAARLSLEGAAPGRGAGVAYDPRAVFLMSGLGYGHPVWGHGLDHGRLATAREDVVPEEAAPLAPTSLHVQALCEVTLTDEGGVRRGRGVLEQLALGPHAPSGFRDLLDGAR